MAREWVNTSNGRVTGTFAGLLWWSFYFTAHRESDRAIKDHVSTMGGAQMNSQILIQFALKASIILSVFAIGLDSRPNDTISLVGRPALLARSLLAMDVIMPVLAAMIVWAFDLHEAVEVSLVALAVSPVPPLLPKKQIKAHGEPSYAIGLLVVAAAVAVVFIPFAIELLGQFLQMPVHMKVWPIAQLVLMTVLAPLVVGMLFRHIAPADRLANFEIRRARRRGVARHQRFASSVRSLASHHRLSRQWHNRSYRRVRACGPRRRTYARRPRSP